MKKVYMIPTVSTLSYVEPKMLCQSRQISGGPTNTGDGIDIPGAVGETDGELDPYDGHGQGTGGSGNRAPERWGSLW